MNFWYGLALGYLVLGVLWMRLARWSGVVRHDDVLYLPVILLWPVLWWRILYDVWRRRRCWPIVWRWACPRCRQERICD